MLSLWFSYGLFIAISTGFLTTILLVIRIISNLNHRTRHPSSMVQFGLLVLLIISLILSSFIFGVLITTMSELIALLIMSNMVTDKTIQRLANKCQNIYPY